jgi:hypothetical protein
MFLPVEFVSAPLAPELDADRCGTGAGDAPRRLPTRDVGAEPAEPTEPCEPVGRRPPFIARAAITDGGVPEVGEVTVPRASLMMFAWVKSATSESSSCSENRNHRSATSENPKKY